MKQYYQLTGEETIMQVNGTLEPLTEEQVLEHQEKYGPNELVEGKKKTTLQIFLEQYKDFLVIILIIAAIASGFMGNVESAIVILIVITMNAILGTVQTIKAEQSLASLKKLSGPEAKVLRCGNVVQIPSSEVTRGRYRDRGCRRLHPGRRPSHRMCQSESGRECADRRKPWRRKDDGYH